MHGIYGLKVPAASSGMNHGDTIVGFDGLVVKFTMCFQECLGADSLVSIDVISLFFTYGVETLIALRLCRLDRAGDALVRTDCHCYRLLPNRPCYAQR